MKIRINKKLYALLLCQSLALTGCALNKQDENSLYQNDLEDINEIQAEETFMEDTSTIDNQNNVDEKKDYKENVSSDVENNIEDNTEEVENVEIVENTDDTINHFTYYDVVVSTTDLNIRDDSNLNSNVIGTFGHDATATYVGEEDNFYIIEYNGLTGYVSKDYSYVRPYYVSDLEPIKYVYCTSDVNVLNAETKDDTYEVLPTYEMANVYEEIDDSYLVIADGKLGYIDKNKTEELPETFVVVDLSEQHLDLYQDGNVVLESPVVTGRPGHGTPAGYFSVFEESYNRYLIGPTWKSYVDVMMKFNGGIGLHDAEYDQHEDGFKHGWRSIDEFGGSTYINNGSHGCVNMPHDKAIEASEIVDVGTKVLVKK